MKFTFFFFFLFFFDSGNRVWTNPHGKGLFSMIPSEQPGRQAAYDALIFQLLIVTLTVPMYSVLCTLYYALRTIAVRIKLIILSESETINASQARIMPCHALEPKKSDKKKFHLTISPRSMEPFRVFLLLFRVNSLPYRTTEWDAPAIRSPDVGNKRHWVIYKLTYCYQPTGLITN